MFTGLVQAIGEVFLATPRQGSRRLGLDWNPAEPLSLGESVAVDGVCLTVAAVEPRGFVVDVVEETLSRTTLSAVEVGTRVNLERSLRLESRLGGHLVQGHVDTTALVRQVVRAGDDTRLSLELPPEIRRFVALKGSITLQGVSLTVSGVENDRFEVALIPETLSRTNLGLVRRDGRLNVEVDLLSRYLDRLLEQRDLPDTLGKRRDG